MTSHIMGVASVTSARLLREKGARSRERPQARTENGRLLLPATGRASFPGLNPCGADGCCSSRRRPAGGPLRPQPAPARHPPPQTAARPPQAELGSEVELRHSWDEWEGKPTREHLPERLRCGLLRGGGEGSAGAALAPPAARPVLPPLPHRAFPPPGLSTTPAHSEGRDPDADPKLAVIS